MTASRNSSLRAGAAQCRELYSEHILLPRIVIVAVLVAGAAALLITTRRRRKRQQYARVPTDDEISIEKPTQETTETPSNTVLHTRLKYSILAWFVWTVIWFWGFQTYDFMTTDSSAPGRPRMVFSFTTTGNSIHEIQPTLHSLLNQTGEGFDTIYLIVPKVYKGKVVEIPEWLVAPQSSKSNSSDFYGWTYTLSTSVFDPKLRVLVLDKDFGPGSKVLGTLLVEQDPETIIVYGDDDRAYPPELASRALYYTMKFPREAIAVLGGWISAEDQLYCGRSLEIGINRVSFVGGAGGVVVRRKFYGKGYATTAAFAITEMSKACFLGDDYYLSLVLSRNHVRRRVVYDSCWSIDTCQQSITRGGLSGGASTHPGGANVEHYQQCIRELGFENDLSVDAEFGQWFMMLFSRVWGVFRMGLNLVKGRPVVGC